MTLIALALVALGQGPAQEPEHAANPVYRSVLDEGLAVGGVTARLPGPCWRDGLPESERRAALKAAVEMPVDEFLRDSVNAPFKLKVREVAYPDGVARVVDLWFAVHADLDEINTDDLSGQRQEGAKVEVGNMSFEVRALDDAELKAHGKATGGGLERYIVSSGLLLDRVQVRTTNHIIASRTKESLVVASRSDPTFGDAKGLGNHWTLLPRPGEARKGPGEPRPYAGSAAYGKISRLSEKPSILVVESHVAFAEPRAWFDGTPILRSKIGLVARDQVRQLRREVARRKKDAKPSTSKP